ncbi:hypothetical protein NECID01_0175 [Nematocida sp. AWRm77]|nr:hypothetical protein NECID01_0175 [Nematocida sp. AWRm77]
MGKNKEPNQHEESSEDLVEHIKKHAFHRGEHKDEEKEKELLKRLSSDSGVFEKTGVKILSFFTKGWVEIVIDLFLFFLVLLPENYEFAHVLYTKMLQHKNRESSYTQYTLAQHFDMWCPIVEGIVCVFHTVVFVCESFLGLEIPYGMLIAILASHITCILIIAHVELIDVSKRHHPPKKRYFVEALVLLFSVIFTFIYFQTEDMFRSFILICTVCTQYLCRSLTRIVHPSHDKVRRTTNEYKFRIAVGTSFLLIILLLEIFRLYFREKH